MHRFRTVFLALLGSAALVLLAPLPASAATNHRPVTQNQTVTTVQDTPVAVTVTATDEDGDALTFYAAFSSGCHCSGYHGTVSGTLPNVTFTPAPGFVGTAEFWFGANDGELNSITGPPETIGVVTVVVTATGPVATPTPTPTPTATATPAPVHKKDCRHGGWKDYAGFANQKACIAAVAHKRH